MAKLRAWLQAARPLAFGNIGLPVVFGAALAASARAEALDMGGLVWALVWGAMDQLCIVFANDVADEALDRTQEQGSLVSGGSRVLVEGKLSARALRRAAIVAGVALCAWSLLGSWLREAWLLPSCAAAALALLWAYSFPPFRLSYRSGGAGLQALGMGVVLPLVGWQLQGASLGDFINGELASWPVGAWLLPGVLMAWSGNWLTAIPDTESDASGGKQTRPVRVGVTRTALEATALCLLAGGLSWGLLADWRPMPSILAGVCALCLIAHRLRRRADAPLVAFVLVSLGATTTLWLALIVGLMR
jgi:1,4-dihydroxy-2-naphthoate octaprenyltransferase